MWKEFYKDGQVYTFEMYLGRKNKEEELISQGYTPVFDRRLLTFTNSLTNGTAILENDIKVPDTLLDLQNEIKRLNNLKRMQHKEYTSLHPAQLSELKELIEDRQIKNIIIDSLFEDIDQFRYAIANVFSYFMDINFFINSHGSLIELLQNEFDNNMDKYKVVNSYYTHGGNDKPWFNDLTFTILKNNIYEYDNFAQVMKRIKCKVGYDKCEAVYDGKYKWMRGSYKTDDTDIIPSEPKSIWK
jgi:hypothetical protein